MVKIDISKIADNEQTLLSQFTKPKTNRWRTWQSRISRFPRAVLWPLLVLVLLLQGFAFWRIFFYEPTLPPSPPYNVTETVGLVTTWYETLQKMKYLGPNAIAYPPHVGDKAINVTLARYLGLDTRVIETMQQLPYIENKTGGWMPPDKDIFWRNGHFVDYRNDTDIWAARDPLLRFQTSYSYKDKTLEDAMTDFDALPTSAVPLSIIRGKGYTRYGLVMVLDTASNRIIVQDTQGGGGWNDDPFFEGFKWDKIPRKYKLKGMFYGEDTLYGRLAPDFLYSYILATANLRPGFTPGSVRQDKQYTPELSPPQWESWIRNLYDQSGWPVKGEELGEYLFPTHNSTVDHSLLDAFNNSPSFEQKMRELQHNITVKYLPDRYCPVPRREDFITKLAALGKLNGEQYKYAKSDEEVIPINLESWGGNLVFMQPTND